jgi:hypothetical protein
MAQADLDQLIARTTNGPVLLSRSARRVEVHSVDGDVITRSAISVTESFGATTIDGDIEVDFKAAPRTLDATTRDGDISIGLPPRGPYVVNANTGEESGATVSGPADDEPHRRRRGDHRAVGERRHRHRRPALAPFSAPIERRVWSVPRDGRLADRG